MYHTEVPAVNVDSEDEVFAASAISGHSLQLVCDVHSAQHLVWTRLGASLHDISQFKASLRIFHVICFIGGGPYAAKQQLSNFLWFFFRKK